MARPASSDPFHNHRFLVEDSGNTNLIDARLGGFTTVTTPNVSVNAVEYREGTYIWTRKYPGIPTVGDLVMSRGIFKRSSGFFPWILRCIEGAVDDNNRPYRSEIQIKQFHITDEFGVEGTPTRVTTCAEVFLMDVKPTGDFDANDDSIQITEATFAVEEISVRELETLTALIP